MATPFRLRAQDWTATAVDAKGATPFIPGIAVKTGLLVGFALLTRRTRRTPGADPSGA